jgi:hypothetical protein
MYDTAMRFPFRVEDWTPHLCRATPITHLESRESLYNERIGLDQRKR